MSQQYGIDYAMLQEVYINWGAFKPSQTLASLFFAAGQIPSTLASHNKRETTNTRWRQWGGTTAILRYQLASFVKDTNVNRTLYWGVGLGIFSSANRATELESQWHMSHAEVLLAENQQSINSNCDTSRRRVCTLILTQCSVKTC